MSRSRPSAWASSIAVIALVATSLPARASDDPDPAAVEAFEKEVRPILANRCQSCHGAEKAKAGLRLDSRAAALAGGESGPAVVPGKPAESLLIEAINRGDVVKMPPKSKLPDAEIAALTTWVERGAHWPGTDPAGPKAKPPADLAERARRQWSFQPVRDPKPPEVRDARWPINDVDRFILAHLETEGLKPAPEADRATLIRRLTFDLTGLPPTPDELRSFESDAGPDAYTRLVDRLLASPHYGERWGRHWLDLVRFAETSGHEFDYDIPGAWRYRDYVVRAFNADLPYNQFVVEHLAGDLLPEPRRRDDGTNESTLGTAVFLLGEGTHSPVDVREEEVRRTSDQVDVISKAFFGLTVACARCHDHKFDAISQRDYYALVGYLQSSRHQQAFLDPPGRIGSKVKELESIKARLIADAFKAGTSVVPGIVGAVAQNDPPPYPPPQGGRGLVHPSPLAGEGRVGGGLEGQAWSRALHDESAKQPGHPLFALAAILDGRFADRRREALDRLKSMTSKPDGSILFEGFDGPDFDGWTVTGDAFGTGPTRPGDARIGAKGPLPVASGEAHSGLVADRLQGVLRSRTFPIERRFIHIRAHGRGGRVNLVVDGFEKIRDPIYGGLIARVEGEAPRWYTIDAAMWAGERAYLELSDGATLDYSGAATAFAPGDGYLAVDEIRVSDGPPPPPEAGLSATLLGDPDCTSFEALARLFGREVEKALADARARRPAEGRLDRERSATLAWLAEAGLLPTSPAPADVLGHYREVEGQIPPPTLAPSLIDGPGEDASLLIRGNHRTPGTPAPRRFVEAVAGRDQPSPGTGSGRLELARRVVLPTNPLTARVMANRIWKGHFGVGIAPTPDDFGAMGQPPTHPELLDWLASRFVEGGWSVKAMHRTILLSRAYRMSSALDPVAERADPTNRRLHRQNLRRLEAEAVRDAMLAVSGRLDRAMGGPSVAPHLTPFMEGRGRPGKSGPLDGDGRRSLYLNVRRNFLTPMLLAFDFPAPSACMGRRNVSNVPAQALTLLDDPFVLQQARLWAERVTAEPGLGPGGRVERMYLAAFGRPPDEAERREAVAFLGNRAGDVGAWAELAHVLFNVKEFLFVR